MNEVSGLKSPVLVVDLDGTLIASDMLYETFWDAFSRHWLTPFRTISVLLRGRAALKRFLCQSSQVDIETLPFNQEVVDYVTAWREAGGRTALVTASDHEIAQKISAYLGIFDEVHGTNESVNLKGENKSAFLEQKFGAQGYVYIGDSTADIAVWEKANKAVTVNASKHLRKRVEGLDCEHEHLSLPKSSKMPYLKALRPHQWLKNILVFLPMLAAHQIDAETAWQSLLAFIAFSFIASSVYVVNDLADLSADRAHPRKKNRPFASGAIPVSHGSWMASGLILLGFAIASMVSWAFVAIMAVYYIVTVAYSFSLKRKLIIDICTLAGLYTIRIIAGGVATQITLSVWLLAFSIFFFFALAAVKRQAELVDSASRGKLGASGRGYQVDDLPLITTMATASGYLSVLVLALYINSPSIQDLYSQPLILWGAGPVLLYWISRVVILTHRGHMHDDPIVFAARDRVSLICFVLIAALAFGGALL